MANKYRRWEFHFIVIMWVMCLSFVYAQWQMPRELRGGIYTRIIESQNQNHAHIDESEKQFGLKIDNILSQLNNIRLQLDYNRELADSMIHGLYQMRNDK